MVYILFWPSGITISERFNPINFQVDLFSTFRLSFEDSEIKLPNGQNSREMDFSYYFSVFKKNSWHLFRKTVFLHLGLK